MRCTYMKAPETTSGYERCPKQATVVWERRDRDWPLCDEHAKPKYHPKDVKTATFRALA